jgi:acetyl esterase/lipase
VSHPSEVCVSAQDVPASVFATSKEDEMLRAVALVSLLALSTSTASAQVETVPNVVYAIHDGVPLHGDLYLPSTPGSHPAMLYIHGGAWIRGSKAGYATTWGPYLAARGIAVFAIDYRLATPTTHLWPQELLDCKAALQYLRGNAAALGVSPDRIGVGGDSAGGELSSMLALTQDWPAFANRYPDDEFASVSTKVKVATPIYGVYDMMAWWKWTTTSRTDKPLEQLFGGTPYEMPGPYYEASPINYVRAAATALDGVAIDNAGTEIPWFVAWGMDDPIVPVNGQGIPFVKALRDAGTKVTTAAVPNIGHFWFTASPLTGQRGISTCTTVGTTVTCTGATPNDFIAPDLLRFLANNL